MSKVKASTQHLLIKEYLRTINARVINSNAH